MARIDLDQSPTSRYQQIAEDLRARIEKAEFGPSGRLPTTRDLARRLGVNRNTVVAAYAKLQEWGVVRPHVGRGTFAVPAGDLEGTAPMPATARTAAVRPSSPWSGLFARTLDGRKVASLSALDPTGTRRGGISFAGSFPAPDLLPAPALSRALARVLTTGPARALAYGPAQGFAPLREWIAEDMTRRGMPTRADEVLITNGSQQAIDLVARAFTDPGDVVLLENPTYSGAISAFQSHGARLSGLPLDSEGIVPGVIGAHAVRGAAKILYVTPTFQNPTTGVLSTPRRRALLEEAAAANLLIVEDDWAAELRFEGEDPPTLRALDRDGRVIYLSTFAKKLIPALRIGWIAAPRPIIEKLVVLKQISDCCTSPLMQAALDAFLRDGGLTRHLPRVRAAYRRRRDTMIAALGKHFPARTSWTRPAGGLFLWVRLPEGADTAALFADAEKAGVHITRGDPFQLDDEGPACLRLTFASCRPSEIDRGIRALGAMLKKQLAAAGRRPASAPREAVPLV